MILCFLDFSLEVCISSVESRIEKKREEMPWIETEFGEEFKQDIIKFHETKLPQIYAMLEKHRDKNIIIFKNRSDIELYFLL